MKKIIVRNKILGRGRVNSAYTSLCNEKIFDTAETFQNKYGIKIIMKELYGEDIKCDSLVDSDLYKSYNLSFRTSKDNINFKIMYKIDDDFAVHLTENIYLYHLAPVKNEVYSNMIPWFYADSYKYIGDTWWEDDIEIINNLMSLTVIEFLNRYKGY